MDLFKSVILAIVATGGVLVIGGIYLIASGAIKLAGEKDGGTTIKIGDLLQVGTTVPGLGIFIVGLVFDMTGLYYANMARTDDIPGQIAKAIERDSQNHALKLAGIVKTKNDQDVRLTVCMGHQLVVESNNPFDEKVGPYLDFIVAKLESAGAVPQQYTIFTSSSLPASFKGFTRLVQPRKDGLVDMGTIQLNQVVDLSNIKPMASAALSTLPAGSAYGGMK